MRSRANPLPENDCRLSVAAGVARTEWFDFREIDFGLGDVIEVVCKDVEGHIGGDLGDLFVAETSVTYFLQILVRNLTPFVDDRPGELEQGSRLRIAVDSCAAVPDLFRTQSCHLPQGAVGGQAVVTLIRFRDGQ